MRMWTYCILAILVLVFGVACARMSDKSTSVMLQNLETMDFVKCNVDQWGTRASFAKNEKCIEDYKRQGYVIWAER
ncbi:MAG: hypothetical protein COA36_00630 [Desulfotalea sp.]|nr:MAG: hypothetical protein COA36_00630 [Desulfotalea sp.]